MATSTKAPEVARTGSGRPRLEKLDVKPIIEQERRDVLVTLDSISDDRARLEYAVRIIAEANGVLAEKEPYLKALALSLALHEGARAVYDTFGQSRSGFYQFTERVLGDETVVDDPKNPGKTKKVYSWPGRPSGWTEEVRDRAKAKKIRFHRDAAVKLPEVAPIVVAAQARHDAAAEVRDALVVKLVDQGLPPQEMADIIGRDRSRVWHIKSRKGDTEG